MNNASNMKVLALAVSTALCAMAANVHAADWYVGAGFGAAHNGKSDSSTASDARSALGASGYSFNNFGSGLSGNMSDQNSTGLKFFVGKQISPYFSVEGQFQGLGKTQGQFSGTVDGPEGGMSTSGTTTYESKSLGIAVVGTLPISKDLSASGKVGVMHWRSEASTNGSVDGTPISRSDKENGNSAYYGLGLKYNFNPIAGVKLEWERAKIHSGNTDLITASIVFGL